MDVVAKREECDNLIKDIPGIGFFISSITAAFDKPKGVRKRDLTRNTFLPAIAYWVVTDNRNFDTNLLKRTLQFACMNSEVVPLGSKPPLNSHEKMCGSVYVTLKDHDNGYIKKRIKASIAALNEEDKEDKEPMRECPASRIVLMDMSSQKDIVKPAFAHLLQAGLVIELLDVEPESEGCVC